MTATGARTPLSAGDRSLLLVDDEAAICRSLESLLDSRGYDVTTTTDGAEALKLIASRHYAYLLLDVNMPRVSGLDLARAAQAQSPRPRIVLITGALDPDYLGHSGLEGENVSLLPKPFHLKDLLTMLGG